MARLTTHVLDTTSGQPAAGMTIELFAVGDGSRERITTVTTNRDGRCDAPLLEGDALQPGTWELLFHVSSYFAARDVALPEPPFLGEVPVRFAIDSADADFHVPLLVSPWSYSVYRGS